jgi:hypothetical protein
MMMALHTAACPNVCGDGNLQEGEQCDDGAANSNEPGAACRTNCRLSFCGDGVVGPGRSCDLAGLNSDEDGSDCSTTCTASMRIVSRDPVSKSAATELCHAIGLEVVKVESEAKNAAVLTLIEGTGYDTWLSGSNSGQFDDGEAMQYTKWNSGEPSGDGTCVEVGKQRQGRWNDIPCGRSNIVVCE